MITAYAIKPAPIVLTVPLATMMQSLSAEAGELAGLPAPSPSGMSVSTFTRVERLMPPDVPMSKVTVSLFWLVFLK